MAPSRRGCSIIFGEPQRAFFRNTTDKMRLHRDIYWVGRQWAVTGYGMQAVDQRLSGVFDIEISRLWDDGLAESLSAGAWLNADDFAKALFIARAKFPEPAQKTPLIDPPEPGASCLEERARVEPPKPVLQNFDMRIEGWTAKLVPSWRVLVSGNYIGFPVEQCGHFNRSIGDRSNERSPLSRSFRK